MSKKVFILGGASGMGRRLVELLLEEGCAVCVSDYNKDAIEEFKSDKGGSVSFIQHDIRDVDRSKDVLSDADSALSGIDLIIITAGISELNSHLEWDLDAALIDTNVKGVSRIYALAFNYFREKGGGHLVGLSSLAAVRGNRSTPSYSASKAYQANYLEALRCISKQKKLNIDVTDIQPGFVDTSLMKGKNLFWVATVDKASRQILKAIKRRKKKAYITKRWAIVAFLYRNIPSWLLEKL